MDTFFLIAVESQAVRNLQIAEKIKNLYEDMKAEFAELLSSNGIWRYWILFSHILFLGITDLLKTRAFPPQQVH